MCKRISAQYYNICHRSIKDVLRKEKVSILKCFPNNASIDSPLIPEQVSIFQQFIS